MSLSSLENNRLSQVWDNAAELRRSAQPFQRQGMAETAEEALQEALLQDQNCIETLTSLALMYASQSNISAAIPYMLRAYDASIEASEDRLADPDICMMLGNFYMQSGLYRPAYRKFSEARKFDTHKIVAIEAMNKSNHAQMKVERENARPATKDGSNGLMRTVSPETCGARHVVTRTPRPGQY